MSGVWVKSEERLPKELESVICICETDLGLGRYLGYYYNGKWKISSFVGSKILNVPYWMNLPEYPEKL